MSRAIFPSMIRDLPFRREYFGGNIIPEYNDYVNNENSFHNEGMKRQKDLVRDRARVKKYNELLYLNGGARNMVPKPQPAGSFLRMNPSSGNDVWGQNTSHYSGKGGSFRTTAGALYGQELLQKRIQQLDEIQHLKEEGWGAIPQTTEPIIDLEATDKDVIAFNLILSEVEGFITAIPAGQSISSFITSGNIDVGKLYELARKIVLKTNLADLQDYYDRVNNINDVLTQSVDMLLAQEIDETEAVRRGEKEEVKATTILNLFYNRLMLIQGLFELAIVNFNLDPKTRQQQFNAYNREITKKMRPPTEKQLEIIVNIDEVIGEFINNIRNLRTGSGRNKNFNRSQAEMLKGGNLLIQKANEDAEMADGSTWETGQTRFQQLAEGKDLYAPDEGLNAGRFEGKKAQTKLTKRRIR